MSGCEEKQKIVLVENEELRLCLRELHKELASLLYCSTLQVQNSSSYDMHRINYAYLSNRVKLHHFH